MAYPYSNAYQQSYMGYPTYQQYQQYQPYQQYQAPAQTQQPIQQSGIIWVQNGLAEAEQYPLAPNSAVALWDAKAPCIYIKQADATGRASIRILDTKERTEASNKAEEEKPAQANLATREDIAAVLASVQHLADLLKKEDDEK